MAAGEGPRKAEEIQPREEDLNLVPFANCGTLGKFLSLRRDKNQLPGRACLRTEQEPDKNNTWILVCSCIFKDNRCNEYVLVCQYPEVPDIPDISVPDVAGR